MCGTRSGILSTAGRDGVRQWRTIFNLIDRQYTQAFQLTHLLSLPSTHSLLPPSPLSLRVCAWPLEGKRFSEESRNCEENFQGGGEAKGENGRWVKMAVCVCVRPCVCVGWLGVGGWGFSWLSLMGWQGVVCVCGDDDDGD